MDLIVTGCVTGTFGVDGFVKVVSSSGESDHFLELKKVYIAFSKHKLTSVRYNDGWFAVEDVRIISSCVLLKLEGVDVVEDAKSFVGAEVQVLRGQACRLSENEVYACDLCLCMLFFNEVLVGKVVNVVDAAGVLLEVVKIDGEVCYIPFNNEFIGVVDIEKRKLELLKGWILE